MEDEGKVECRTCGTRVQIKDAYDCKGAKCDRKLCDSCSVLDDHCSVCIENMNDLVATCPGCDAYIDLDEEMYPIEDHYCPGAPCRECGYPIKRLAGRPGADGADCLYRCHVCRLDYTAEEVLEISQELPKTAGLFLSRSGD